MEGVFGDAWQHELQQGAFGARWTYIGKRLGAREVGITLYEVDPGKGTVPYHAHFGIEELVVVLRGTPTLRTPAGTRELAEGEVVVFPRGREGAHEITNASGAPVRFLALSSMSPADVIEYPETGTVVARSGQGDRPDDVTYHLSMDAQVAPSDEPV